MKFVIHVDTAQEKEQKPLSRSYCFETFFTMLYVNEHILLPTHTGFSPLVTEPSRSLEIESLDVLGEYLSDFIEMFSFSIFPVN